MAIQTHIGAAPARFAGLPGAGDRSKALRAAKRHSALVKLLKLLLPLSAMAISVLYFLPSAITVPVPGGGEASVEDIQISDGGLKMINPRIKGVHEKHGVYDIKAESATQHVKNPDLITLHTVNGEVVSKAGQKTVLTAPSGIFHSKQEELTFDKGVNIDGEAGYAGRLQTATAFLKTNLLISHDPVDLTFQGSTIQARRMTLYTSENRAVFEGNVRVHLKRKPKEAGDGTR
jgi:lipopolysaccharide export system protein LptC